MSVNFKTVCDVGSACAAILSWAGAINAVLAVIASTLSIAWFGWRFYKEWRDSRPGPEPPA